MRRIVVTLVCGVLLLVQLPGCGGARSGANSQVSTEEANKVKSTAELKARLEEIAKSGKIDSSVAGMKTGIQAFDKKELAEDLLKDFAKLEAATNPAEIKEIATRMAGKL